MNAGEQHRFVVMGSDLLIVHNCVQATARDCLKESMLALNDAGFDIRAHVHDEVISLSTAGVLRTCARSWVAVSRGRRVCLCAATATSVIII